MGFNYHYKETVYFLINSHNYPLAKVGEIKAYFLMQFTEREKVAKKMQLSATIFNASDTG